jgi:hypothetical protein
MVQVSEGSGGQVFLLDPSELASSATLLMARDGLDETLRRVVGELEPGTRSIDVDVDSSVERILFSISLQCLQEIEIARPSGTSVAASDPGVTWTSFQAGRQIGIDKPEAGLWRVHLAGNGLLFLVVNARASVELAGVRLVRAGGRPGHEGLFRDDDTPLVAATRRLMEIRLSQGILEPTFEMRRSTDDPVGALTAARQPGDADEQIYLAEFLVPSSPLRVVMTGRDAAGKTVKRVQGALFQLSQPR